MRLLRSRSSALWRQSRNLPGVLTERQWSKRDSRSFLVIDRKLNSSHGFFSAAVLDVQIDVRDYREFRFATYLHENLALK